MIKVRWYLFHAVIALISKLICWTYFLFAPACNLCFHINTCTTSISDNRAANTCVHTLVFHLFCKIQVCFHLGVHINDWIVEILKELFLGAFHMWHRTYIRFPFLMNINFLWCNILTLGWTFNTEGVIWKPLYWFSRCWNFKWPGFRNFNDFTLIKICTISSTF